MKTLGIITVILAVLAFIFLFVVPNILATSWGKAKVMNLVNSRIKGKVSFESLDTHWFGVQTIEGLTFKDSEDHILFNVPKLKVETSWLRLLWNPSKEAITIKLEGDVQALEQTGHVDFLAVVENGPFPESLKSLEAKLNHFPTHLIEKGIEAAHLFPLDSSFRNKIEALIGTSFNLEAKVYLQNNDGTISLNITGSHSRINADAQLHEGILTLVKPLEAKLTVTPELGQEVLQELIPLLSGVISAENEVALTLHPAGFSYRLKSQDIRSLEIGLMTINLNKITFSNKGQLGHIMSLLKTHPAETIPVWFTPIYLDMHNSKIQIQRFDMLVMNKYPLATWGTVDFLKDRIDVIIGVKGKSLENFVKVSSLKDNYMLQLPFKGKIGRASLDKTKLAVQIAALVSTSNGTSQGTGFGALMGLASGTLLKDSPPPEPTTQPLPWESKNPF
jgi:hypothetical protein